MRSRTQCRASHWLFTTLMLSGCGLLVEDWRIGESGGSAGNAAGGEQGAGGDPAGGGGGSGAPDPAWCRFYGTEASESLWDVRPDADGTTLLGAAGIGGPITLGSFAEPGGSSDGIVVRFDGAGEPSLVAQLGASQSGVFNSVLGADPPLGGGYYAGTAGPFSSEGDVDVILVDAAGGPLIAAGTSDPDTIVDADVRGDLLVFTGPSGAGLDFGAGPAPSGGFIAFASRESGTVYASIALGAGSSAGTGHMARISPAGDVVWASARLGGPGSTDVLCDAEPLVTEASEQWAILELSPEGDCIAGRPLPVEVTIDPDIAVREDGGVIVSGRFTQSFTVDGLTAGPAKSSSDAFVAVVAPDLTFTRLFTYGGAGNERPNEVIVGPDGSTFVAGEFSGAMTVGATTVASVDEGDVYVMKLDPELEPSWLRVFAGSGLVTTSALTLDGAGNLYLGGSAEGSLECASPAPMSAGSRDMFLMRFDAKDL